MATTVRLFAYSGTIALPNAANNDQMLGTTLFMLKQTYLNRETLAPTTGSAALSASALSAHTSTRMLHVQVQPGKRVHYEVYGPNASAVVADTSSPVITGHENLEFYSGWHISLLEVTEV